MVASTLALVLVVAIGAAGVTATPHPRAPGGTGGHCTPNPSCNPAVHGFDPSCRACVAPSSSFDCAECCPGYTMETNPNGNLTICTPTHTAVFVRHLNTSVVPERCGDVNVAIVLPQDLTQAQVQAYAQATVDLFQCDDPAKPSGCAYLELSTCASYKRFRPDLRRTNFTKPGNPAVLPTPWLTPAAPGFEAACLKLCGCTPFVSPVHRQCAGYEERGTCEVCDADFNKKLEGSLVNLWCDPRDLACAQGLPSRPRGSGGKRTQPQ